MCGITYMYKNLVVNPERKRSLRRDLLVGADGKMSYSYPLLFAGVMVRGHRE
jgi:hypothetical protein